MTTSYAPDMRHDFTDQDEYIVPAGETVRSGSPVKLSALDNPNPTTHKGRVIQEATAATDEVIGHVAGHISYPRESFSAGSIVRIIHLVSWVSQGISTGNITAGMRVVAAAGGYAPAPAFAAGGSTLVNSPGIALDAATSGKAFTFLPLPKSYTAA